MRIRKIFVWLCGVILCCAVPAVFCQALSGSLAAGTGLSTQGPSGGNGMGSISARSEVSANANFTMNADFRASVKAETISSALAHGGGAVAVSPRLNFRVASKTGSERNLNEPTNGRLDLSLARESAGVRNPESKRKEGLGPLSARRGMRDKSTQAEWREDKRASRARNGLPNKLTTATRRQAGASYSTDFPDSTKGTALLSPPDSTGSPLNWNAAMDFTHPDFAERQFMEPSLHRGISGQKRRVAKRTKTPVMGSIPSNALTDPGFSTSLDDSLRVHVPDPLADLVSR